MHYSADFSVVAFRSLFLELLPLLQLFTIRKTNTVYTLQSFGVSFALPVSRTILNKHRKNYRFVDQQQFYIYYFGDFEGFYFTSVPHMRAST